MKLFTKFGIALLALFFSSGVLWAQSALDIAPKKAPVTIATDDLFDLQFDWVVGVGGGEAGIETNGNYIYTSKWNGTGEYYKYNMDGSYVGQIMVTGAGAVRDLAFNGTYFYGAAAATTVFEMDLDNAVKISQFTAPIAVRAIAYNEVDDAFYGNNWSDNITKFNSSGANLGSFPVGPIGTDYYGFAFDNYSLGAPYLWGYAQTGTTLNELVQIQLPGGTETGTYFDVGTVAAVGTGIAGGLCIDDNLVSGFWTIMGTSQNVDIWGLELCLSGPPLTNDVGISAIVSPVSGMNLGDEVVTVTVKNFGTAAQSNIPISYSMDGGTPVTATIAGPIAGGATVDYTFPGTVDLSAYGTYDFESCTYLAGDENPANDCKTKTVENSAGAYCDATTSTEDEYISNVLFGSIDNTSGWQGGVADYTAMSTEIAAGASEFMTITNPVPYASDLVSVWVDWNMDYEFSLTNEQYNLTNVGGSGASFTGDITVPDGTPGGDYRMRIRLMYNIAPNPCGNMTYGEVEDYTIVVPGGGSYIFNYDFENFTAGGQVACQFPLEWTTWSNAPCGAEDAYVSTEQAYSGVNSVLVTGSVTDLVKEFDDYTSGHYKISFQFYVETGNVGYFNTLQDFAGASSQWGMQVYFGADNTVLTPGVGWIDGGGALSGSFNFSYDTWMLIEVDVDLNQDWAEFFVDGNLVVGWVWSSGAFGTGTLNKLDANDFFAYTGATPGTWPCKYFFDDYTLEEIIANLNTPLNLAATVNADDVTLDWDAPTPGSGTLEGYNVYRDGNMIDYTTGMTYLDSDLDPDTYIYYVTAVYTEGESGPSNEATAVIPDNAPPAPQNLEATGQADGILLTWDPVGAGEWIQWDLGVNNGNGIGLTAGGSFNVASHWAPADLGLYNGYTLSKVSFFPNADPAATYVIKVWTGAAGTTLVSSETVTSFTVDIWNEITLSTPVLINSASDLWFGYTVTHGTGTYPAGCDDGPAVQTKGDMISLGGAWESMSASYGLDYNWNLAGFVSATDGKGVTNIQMLEKNFPVNLNSTLVSATESGVAGNQSVKFVPASTKDFTYNVYHGTTMGGPYNILTPTPIVPTQYLHALPSYGWNYYVVTTMSNGYESEYSNEAAELWVGIGENGDAQLQIFPNPAINAVNITSDYTIKSVKVYNHAGQIISTETVDADNYQINTSEFNSGMYLFMIETNEGTITERIIIE